MNYKKQIKLLLAIVACALPCASSFANEAPKVLWDKQAINGVERYDNSVIKLADESVLREVGELVDKRLSLLRSQGKLPFETAIINGYQNNDIQGKMASGNSIALVPVITSDTNTHKSVTYNGNNYYTYEVRAELNVLLCTYDGGSLKVVHNAPLANCAVLGGSLEDALTEPLSVDVLKEQFVYNIEQLLEDLEFPITVAEKLNYYEDITTYQVKDVNVNPLIRSNYANNDLSDYRIDMVAKPVVASTYTSLYAKKYPDRIVLPSKLSGEQWRRAVTMHINSDNPNSAEYNPKKDDGNIGINISLHNFVKKIDEGNKYSIMTDWYYISDLEAAVKDEANGKEVSLGRNVAFSKFRLPKTIGYNVDINYLEIFDDAARKLGETLTDKKSKK